MAYGPPTKKQKTQNDENENRTEFPLKSNGISFPFCLKFLSKSPAAMTQL